MTQLSQAMLTALVLTFTSAAVAQPLPPGHPQVGSSDMPPGHPQVGGSDMPPGHPQVGGSDMPPGHPQVGSSAMPPGHPQVGSSAMPPGHPGAVGGQQPSVAFHDPSLPRGDVLIMGRDPDGHFVTGDAVSVTRWVQGASEPQKAETRTGRLDKGKASFHKLPSDPTSMYQVTIRHDEIDYPSPIFQLAAPAGVRVQQVLFPGTDDIDDALVGVQAFLMIEPQEHGLHVQQLFRLANISAKTWRCHHIPVRLPPGFHGMSKPDADAPLHIQQVAGAGVLLEGFVPPGPTEVAFSYELPYPSSDRASWTFGLPPRVAEARAIVVTSRDMKATFPGLGSATHQVDAEGRRLLVAAKSQEPGDNQIGQLSVTINGLPVPGHSRWIALGLSILLIGFGAIELLRSRHRSEKENERDLLLRQIRQLRQTWDDTPNPEAQLASFLHELARII